MGKNRLVAQRVYLAGPIDYADDDGIGWRQAITPKLEAMNIMVMDPTNKMTTNTRYNEVGEEQNNLKELKKLGRWHELRSEMKPIVLVDLRMVEIADFVIAYIDQKHTNVWNLGRTLRFTTPKEAYICSSRGWKGKYASLVIWPYQSRLYF